MQGGVLPASRWLIMATQSSAHTNEIPISLTSAIKAPTPLTSTLQWIKASLSLNRTLLALEFRILSKLEREIRYWWTVEASPCRLLTVSWTRATLTLEVVQPRRMKDCTRMDQPDPCHKEDNAIKQQTTPTATTRLSTSSTLRIPRSSSSCSVSYKTITLVWVWRIQEVWPIWKLNQLMAKLKILIKGLQWKEVIIRFSTLSNLKQIWMSLLVITTRVERNQGHQPTARSTLVGRKSTSSNNLPMAMPTPREQPAWPELATINKWEGNSLSSNPWMEIIWRPLSSHNSNSATVACLTNTGRMERLATSLTSPTSSNANNPWTSTEFRTHLTWPSNPTPPHLLSRQLKNLATASTTRLTSKRTSEGLKTCHGQGTSMCLRRSQWISL